LMPSYRGMTRGLCAVSGSFGMGIGQVGLLIRFKPEVRMESSLSAWLLDNTLPGLPSRDGLGSAHLFEGALAPPMTNEQRIRGMDAGVDWALFVTGYSEVALARLADGDLSRARIEGHGGRSVSAAMYRMHYMLTSQEVSA